LHPHDKYGVSLSKLNQFVNHTNVHDSTEELIVLEALKNVVKTTNIIGKNEEALIQVESLINISEENTELYRRANYAKARLKMRLGDIEEAMQIFNRGIMEKWEENAFWELNDSLRETDQLDRLAIDEYRRNSTDEYSKELRGHYGIGHDLCIFFMRLNECKLKNSVFNAENLILSQLQASSWRPHVIDTAKALCLAVDGEYSEALQILNDVDQKVQDKEEDKNEQEEWKFIPLYKFIVLLYEGENFDQLQLAVQEFIERNREYPEYIANRTLEFLYSLEKNREKLKDAHHITEVFIENRYLEDQNLLSQINDDKKASLFDMHAQSLLEAGKWQEAKPIFQYVYDTYFPNNLESISAGYFLADILHKHEGNTEEARILLREMLDNIEINSENHEVIAYIEIMNSYLNRLN